MTDRKAALDALELYLLASYPDLDNRLKAFGAFMIPHVETIRNALMGEAESSNASESRNIHVQETSPTTSDYDNGCCDIDKDRCAGMCNQFDAPSDEGVREKG